MVEARPNMGNNFHGYIYEFPGIRVDCFDSMLPPTITVKKAPNIIRSKESKEKQQDLQFYLLTHAHDDHMKGLSNKSFPQARVYCSTTSKEILLQKKGYESLRGTLRDLPLNVRHKVSYNGKDITISLIPSYHCPGSVMFLIEDGKTNVLLTGDVRAEAKLVESLADNLILFPYTNGTRELDNIYLDTTYGYREQPYIQMIDNNEGLKMLVNDIGTYPDDEDVTFHHAESILGFEEVWAKLATVYDAKIHTNQEIIDRTEAIFKADDPYAKLLLKCLSTQGNHKFHICGRYPDKCNTEDRTKFNVRIRAVIDITLPNLVQNNIPRLMEEIKGLTLVGTTASKHKIFERQEHGELRRYLNPRSSNILLRDQIIYFFSRHSSYQECRNLIGKFHVKQVYPIVESSIIWREGFQMERHFGDLCSGSEFIYDKKCTLLYSDPPLLMHRPQTVDKLEFRESLEVLLKSVEKELKLKGIMEINTTGNNNNDELEDRQRQIDSCKILDRCLRGKTQYRTEKRIHNNPDEFFPSRRRAESLDSERTSNEDEDDDDYRMHRFNMELQSKMQLVLEQGTGPGLAVELVHEQKSEKRQGSFTHGESTEKSSEIESQDCRLQDEASPKVIKKPKIIMDNKEFHPASKRFKVYEEEHDQPERNQGQLSVYESEVETVADTLEPETPMHEVEIQVNETIGSDDGDLIFDSGNSTLENDEVIHMDVDDEETELGGGGFLPNGSFHLKDGITELRPRAKRIRDQVRNDTDFGFFGIGLTCGSTSPTILTMNNKS